MALLSGFGKRGVDLNLLTKPSDILDTEFLSKYFVLQEFSPKLTAGRNSITFNGSDFLQQGSEVQVECVDSAGNPLYIESTAQTNIAYREASSYILTIHVYNEIANGPGQLVLYGTTIEGFTVKWVGNVIIDKTQQNESTVRFYNKPVLEVNSVLSPVLGNVGSLSNQVRLTGSFYSFAVNPPKDSFLINKRNVDVDYRVFYKNLPLNSDPTKSFNSQLNGTTINFNVKTIQQPYSYASSEANFTSSFVVKKVLNNTTLILGDVISHADSKNNDVSVNVIDGDFNLSYTYILYNTASESSNYLYSNTRRGPAQIKQSYADIIYRNIRTFSGFIARHKVYKKSLFIPGDFVVIADEPLSPYELLRDKITTNKSFDLIGSFYNQTHVNKYWFTSSNNLQLVQDSTRLIDAVKITYNGNYENLNSLQNYVIVKDNTSIFDRNARYYPYDSVEFSFTSGSSYDSNFVALKKDVNYIISLNAIIKKDDTTLNDTDAGLEFYFTSSLPQINFESNLSRNQSGLLQLGIVSSYEPVHEKIYTNTNILFSVSNDLYGTLVIVPKKCTAIISELSLKPYGDYGFSPDTLITRIPFPISVANEAFEVKAELFDVNSTLVYSDLRTITSFDPSGSSLSVYIPGYNDPTVNDFISGSLTVSQSLWIGQNASITGSLIVGGTVKLTGIQESSYTTERMLAWNPTTNLVSYTNVNDIDHSGSNEITLKLYDKNTNNVNSYRVIPAEEGRNIFVPSL